MAYRDLQLYPTPRLPPLNFKVPAYQHRVARWPGIDTGWRSLHFSLFETPIDGKWIVQTETATLEVPAGQGFVITAGTRHRLTSPDQFLSCWHYAFWEVEHIPLRIDPGVAVLPDSCVNNIIGITEILAEGTPDLAGVSRIKRHGLDLLDFILANFKIVQVEDEQISRVIRYARDHFREPLTRDDLAKVAGVSRSRLHDRFCAITGEAPMQYVQRLRLQHATTLLLNTDESIGRIAEQCGFESIYYFSRHFKKQTGIPPSQLRDKGP